MTAPPPKHVVILGGSFAGLTAAYEIKGELGGKVRVMVIDKNENFVFIPSLIWVPFGRRTPEQISFPLKPAVERKGAEFLQAVARKIDPDAGTVEVSPTADPSNTETIGYDYLLVATGPHVQLDAVPGLGPHGGHTVSICTADHALHAKAEWEKFMKDPGPVIVGATQGAACYGAAYEFVFNLEYALRRAKVRDEVSVTYVTSEPFPGHFGIGGLKHAQGMTEWFFRHVKIDWAVNAVMGRVTPGEVHFKAGQLHHAEDGKPVEDLAGRSLPFRYAMIIPPFQVVEVVRAAGLGNDRGFVVAADIEGRPLTPKPQADIDAKCILDAGNQGIIMYTDRVYAPKRRKWQSLIPGPWAHWAKLAFEKYFLWKMRTGRVNWP